MSTFKFRDRSGKGYSYLLMPSPGQPGLSPQGGNYIFATGTAANPIPVFVAETHNLRDAAAMGLERWETAQTVHGATLFYICIEDNQQVRHAEKIDLVRAYHPAMNADSGEEE